MCNPSLYLYIMGLYIHVHPLLIYCSCFYDFWHCHSFLHPSTPVSLFFFVVYSLQMHATRTKPTPFALHRHMKPHVHNNEKMAFDYSIRSFTCAGKVQRIAVQLKAVTPSSPVLLHILFLWFLALSSLHPYSCSLYR